MAREGSRQAKPGVFLSYARTDHSLASQLAQGLEERGLSVWWDAQIRVGDSWEQAIKRALLLADVVLVLVTPSSVESRWVTNEWSSAMEQSQLVIPVVGGGLSLSDLPHPLAGIQGVEFDPDDPSGFDLLTRAIRHAVGSPDPAVERPAAVLDVDRIANMAAEQVLKQLRHGPLAQPPCEATDATLVFVVMSFTPDMEPTFEAIDAAAVTVGLRAQRVKDVPGDYRITDQILRMIRSSRLVVADLTHERPNVYFELGYARGIGKTVITIVRSGSDPHFDVRDWTFLEYSDSRPLERDLLRRFEYELQRV